MKLIVNGKTIDQKEIDQEVDRLRPQYQRFAEQHGGKSSHEELHKWCKENLIERTLMQQAAVAEVSAIPPSEIAVLVEAIQRSKRSNCVRAMSTSNHYLPGLRPDTH